MIKKIILLVLLLFLVTGCYDYRELNDLAIVDAIGIDYEDDMFIVTAQVLDVKKQGSEQIEEKPNVYTGKAKSIPQAIRKMSLDNPRDLYLAHLELVILGKSLTGSNVDKAFEFFLRDPHVKSETPVVATVNSSAYDILNQQVNSESYPSKSIISSIQISAQKEGIVKDQTLQQLIKTTLQEGIEPVITTIEIEPQPKDKETITEFNRIKLGNLAVIKNNEIIDMLTKEESIALNIINNEIKSIMMNVSFEDTKSVIEISNPKSKIDLKINEQKPEVIINVKVAGDVTEVNKKINISDQKELKKLATSVDQELTKYINSLIKKCQDNNTDILGLGSLINKKYNKQYKEYKDKNLYEISNIKIKVKSEVYKEGNTYDGI